MNLQHYRPEYLVIHKALHNPAQPTEVELPDGTRLPILRHGGSQFRYVSYRFSERSGVAVMEQNINKPSRYSDRARRGEQISWVAPLYGSGLSHGWLIIDNNIADQLEQIPKTT